MLTFIDVRDFTGDADIYVTVDHVLVLVELTELLFFVTVLTYFHITEVDQRR